MLVIEESMSAYVSKLFPVPISLPYTEAARVVRVFDNLNEYHLNLGDRRSTLFLISLCTFLQDLRMVGLILTEVACSIQVYGEAPRLRSDWSGRSIPDFYDPNLDEVRLR